MHPSLRYSSMHHCSIFETKARPPKVQRCSALNWHGRSFFLFQERAPTPPLLEKKKKGCSKDIPYLILFTIWILPTYYATTIRRRKKKVTTTSSQPKQISKIIIKTGDGMRTTKLPERQGKKTEWQSYVRLVHRHTKEKKKNEKVCTVNPLSQLSSHPCFNLIFGQNSTASIWNSICYNKAKKSRSSSTHAALFFCLFFPFFFVREAPTRFSSYSSKFTKTKRKAPRPLLACWSTHRGEL